MSRRIAVAGATGVVGRMLVEVLGAHGHAVVPMSRSTGVDLVTGDGLDEALTGVDTVVDASGPTTSSAAVSARYFRQSTLNLLDGERRHGVGHHVVLSIVGTDRVRYGYYAGKRVQESLTVGGPVPYTILRTTQFHEFAEQMARRMRVGPVVLVPTMVVRPVAATEVAHRLAATVEAGPAGVVRDLAGPRVHTLLGMTRAVCRGHRRRPLVLPLRVPGPGGADLAGGALLPTEPFDQGRLTFDEWLGGVRV